MNLYISDLHFGHKDIINFDHRPFRDVDEMDRCLIKLWNSRVQKNDDIYIVGDFACDNEKPEQWYLRQLRGNKHLIVAPPEAKIIFAELNKPSKIKLRRLLRPIRAYHFPSESENQPRKAGLSESSIEEPLQTAVSASAGHSFLSVPP